MMYTKRGFSSVIAVSILFFLLFVISVSIFIYQILHANKTSPSDSLTATEYEKLKSQQVENLVLEPSWKKYTNTALEYSINYPPDLQVTTTVPNNPDNYAQTELQSTCCIAISDSALSTKLKINTYQSTKTIEDLKKEFASGTDYQEVEETAIGAVPALKYKYKSETFISTFRKGYQYEFVMTDQELAPQLLLTLQFSNQ